LVESVAVDLEHGERFIRQVAGDFSLRLT